MKAQPALVVRSDRFPCTVPPAGAAVVLVDGAVAPDGVRGPGELRREDFGKKGQNVGVMLFPSTSLQLPIDVAGLQSAELVRLDLSLPWRCASPIR